MSSLVTACSYFYLGDASQQFQKSLKDGFLNITVVTVIFCGLKSPLVSDVKRRVFQEPPSLSETSQLIDHNVYFRADGTSTLQKIQPHNYDDIICYAMITDEVPADTNQLDLPPLPLEPGTKVTSAEDIDMSQSASESVSTTQISEELGSHYKASIEYTIDERRDQDEMRRDQDGHDMRRNQDEMRRDQDEMRRDQNVPEQKTEDSEQLQKSEQSDGTNKKTKLKTSLQSIEINSFIDYMRQFNTTGKVELYHILNYGHDFCASEIFKVFMKNVSLCILVTDDSNDIGEEELRILQENQTFASKGLVIKSISGENVHLTSKNAMLHEYSSFLLSYKQSQDYVFPINSKEIEKKDNETIESIIDHSLSSSVSNKFPLSWYFFGFKLQENMVSRNLNVISVREDCMVIARQLNMNKVTVIAALQHLTDNNILLYFRDVMEDTVFSGLHIFSTIFTKIYKVPPTEDNMHSAIVTETLLNEATSYFVNESFSSRSFIIMFIKLLIMAPYNLNYLIPAKLPLLTSTELHNICSSASDLDTAVACIKCPSKGYEYICMLMVFLLEVPSPKWRILQDKSSGLPVCLYKNCAKYLVGDNYEVTLSFADGVLHVHIKEYKLSLKPDYSAVSLSILQGLEKIKLILNVHQQQSFDFFISFICNCGTVNNVHYATYDVKSERLHCESNQDAAMKPSSVPNSAYSAWFGKFSQ